MGILDQIRSDAAFFRGVIDSLSGPYATVATNGVLLSGKEREEMLEAGIAHNRTELKRVEAIVDSGIIPDKYFSVITGKMYYPSAEELKKSEPLPPAKHSFFVAKISRHTSEQKHSSLTVLRDDARAIKTFFMEHKADKKYPSGGFAARVKQGFLKEEDVKPKFAVKIYHQNNFSDNTVHELRLAMRAAYCYKQLGREGYSFRRNKKQYMVTEWLQGASLDQADSKAIQTMPIAQRIVMAISLLRELGILHKQGLIHNDIKPGNVIANWGELRFVDLDSVRPKNEFPFYGSVPMYTETFLPDPQMSYDAKHNPSHLYLKFNEKTDLFAIGLTLAFLFPEIYNPVEINQEIKVNGGQGGTHIFNTIKLVFGLEYGKHPGLEKVIEQMVMQQESTPITVDQFILDLESVLTAYPDYKKYLKEDRLKDLGKDLSPTDGEKAFKEIEAELVAFNQRNEVVVRKFAK